MLEHVKEMRVAVNVGIGVHTDEVRGGPNSGSSAIGESKDIGAVATRAAIDTGDVKARWPSIVSPTPVPALGTERLEHLMPSLGGLEPRDARGGVVTGRVDDGIFGEDSDATVVTGGACDGVVSAPVCSLANRSGARDVGAKTGLVSSVKRVCRVVSNGLPCGMGMPSLLEGNNGGIIVCAQSRNGGPVRLEARDVETD